MHSLGKQAQKVCNHLVELHNIHRPNGLQEMDDKRDVTSCQEQYAQAGS